MEHSRAARHLLSSLAVLAFLTPWAAAESDPKAVAVAERVMERLGGEEAWQATRYLRFDFAVDREGKTLILRAAATGSASMSSSSWGRKTRSSAELSHATGAEPRAAASLRRQS